MYGIFITHYFSNLSRSAEISLNEGYLGASRFANIFLKGERRNATIRSELSLSLPLLFFLHRNTPGVAQHNKSHPGSRNASTARRRAGPCLHARACRPRTHVENYGASEPRGREGRTQEARGESACPFTEPRGDSSPGETL